LVITAMSAEKPLVYLVLGATGSGRREIVADLITGGLDERDRPAVILPAGEAAAPAEARLPTVSRWNMRDGAIEATLPVGASPVFFFVDGARNPVDQIEAFKTWLGAQNGELARVLCVVNCRLAADHPPLLPWFEACVHFADAVLLNKRDGVANKWMSDFLGRFKKQYLPCIFEMVKDGQVKNPALILEPQARRMTQVFDEEQDWLVIGAGGEEADDLEEGEEGDEEVEAAPAEDPYFARRLGGRRVKELPDIAQFLGGGNEPSDGQASPRDLQR